MVCNYTFNKSKVYIFFYSKENLKFPHVLLVVKSVIFQFNRCGIILGDIFLPCVIQFSYKDITLNKCRKLKNHELISFVVVVFVTFLNVFLYFIESKLLGGQTLNEQWKYKNYYVVQCQSYDSPETHS